jgi:hypothetical protein
LRIAYFLDNKLADGGGVVRLSCPQCTLLPVGILPVLISDGGSLNPRTLLRLEQLNKLKNPLISSGIEVVTFQLSATYATSEGRGYKKIH